MAPHQCHQVTKNTARSDLRPCPWAAHDEWLGCRVALCGEGHHVVAAGQLCKRVGLGVPGAHSRGRSSRCAQQNAAIHCQDLGSPGKAPLP